jgi:hypothetical protein
MTPPTRLPAEPQADVDIESPGRLKDSGGPSAEVGTAQAAVIAAQQAAGNKAVSSVLGGDGRGVQRAPNDDPRTSGMAHAPTLDPRPSPAPNIASPMAVAPTLPPAAPPLSVSTTTMVSGAPAPAPGGVAQAPESLNVSTRTLDSSAPGPLNVSTRTLDSSAPAPGSGRQPAAGASAGGSGPAPARQPPPQASQPGPAPTPWWSKDSRFAVGGEFGPKPVGPGQFGGAGKPVSVDPRPVPVNAAIVDGEFNRDPSRVIRAPSSTWLDEAWDKSQPTPRKGEVRPPTPPTPPMFSDGRFTYVSPDYRGNATDLPQYAAIGGAGTKPAPTPGSPTPPGPAHPRVLDTHGPAPDKMRQAVAPNTPFTGEPRGTQKAVPTTFSEVAAALEKDPTKVVRSPNDRWHRQGYRLDGGGREAPGAFKVGDLYVIAPDYPTKGVPKLGETAPPKPSALPQAAQTVNLGGTTYAERSTLKSYAATTTEAGGRTETRTRTREQGVVTTADEVTEGGITNRQEKQRGAGVGVGGNLIGATAGSTTSSKIEGDVVATTKNRQFNAGLGTDAKLGAEMKSTKEIVVGTDPDGNPIKKSTSTNVGGKVDLEGNVNLAAGRQSTNERGTTKGFGGGAKIDRKGNVEVELNYNIQSKSGLSFKPTASRGVKVEASDPVPVEGGFEVTYRIADTTGAGLGLGKQTKGGASFGLTGGATEADFQGGKRVFKTQDEAEKFRDNAAERVASERMFTPVLDPATVAGALQIPEGETRSSGDISGRSIGASAGYSGVALNVSKSKSTTREVAIKRTGTSTVEVTGSVAGSKTGSVGISAPALTHGYSSTNTTNFAVTFEFDLSKEQGRTAFLLYCRTGWPPPQTPKVIEKGSGEADTETFTIAGLGTVVWTGTTWKTQKQLAGGATTEVYGGAQIHEQKPGTVGKWIGEDTLKSNASIIRAQQDNEDVGARAQFTVGGSSGEYNRKELGKIFTGAKTSGNEKPSGEWTLSAPIPKDRIADLERVAPTLRRAAGMDEKMEAYSKLVKEHGAGMLGGQVGGSTSKAWDLELKGDPNFPGEKERSRLADLRKSLMATIRAAPESAMDVIRQANQEMENLAKRRAAVADEKRYTDLPDGLRQQQLSVIDAHVDDLKVVRRTAQAVAMKRDSNEKASDIAARVEKADAAKPGRKGGGKAAGKAGKATPAKEPDDPAAKADREYARLQDLVGAKSSQIAAKRKVVREHSIALGDAIGAKGSVAIKFGADTQVVQMQTGIAKVYINLATEADKKQDALEAQIEAARNAWSSTTDRPAQLAAIKTLEKLLDERLKLMEITLYNIREAGQAVFHITTRGARAGNPAFWNSLGETEGEE